MNQTKTTAVPSPQWFSKALAQRPESYYFSFRDARLHYLHWPEANTVNDNNNTKPALLFIHGFRGHARWWAGIAPTFTQHYQVYALDFSGMGDSDNRETYKSLIHSEEILAFIEHLQVEQITVVSHSFAGARTFKAAQQNASVFKKIIAVDSYVGFGGGFAGTDPAPQAGIKIYPSLADGMARFRLVPPQSDDLPYIRDYIAEHSLRPVDKGWTWKFDPDLAVANILVNDGEETLAAVKCPVDYIYGERSAVINVALAQKIYANLAQPGRLIKIPNGHHHLMVSHPVELIQALQALL